MTIILKICIILMYFFVKAGFIMEKSLMIINNINNKSKLYEAYSILVNQKQGIIAYKGR